MQQSNAIFAFILGAFVVYITVRGELPTYLGFLLAGSEDGVGVANNGAGAGIAPVSMISSKDAAGIVQGSINAHDSALVHNIGAVTELAATVGKYFI